MLWDIYTTGGGGDIFIYILNAATICLSDNVFGSLVKLVVLSWVVYYAYQYFLGHAEMDNFYKSLMTIIVVGSVGIYGTSEVVIHDRMLDSMNGSVISSNREDRVISKVPNIFAVPYSILTTVTEKLKDSYSRIYPNNTDETYRKYGAIYGAKLLALGTSLKITDSDLEQNMGNYFKQCVLGDVRGRHAPSGRYDIESLKNTSDMMKYLKDNAPQGNTNLIALIGDINNNEYKPDGYVTSMQGEPDYVTCKEAINRIDNYMQAKMPESKDIFGGLLGSSIVTTNDIVEKISGETFSSLMGSSYKAFIKDSQKTTNDILKQVMLVNNLKDLGSRYAYAKSNAQIAKTHEALYNMSKITTISYQSVLESLYIAMLPIILLLTLIPRFGSGIASSYAQSFLWLQLWAFFDIALHVFFHYRMNGALAAASTLSGGNGIAFVSSDSIIVNTYSMIQEAELIGACIPFVSLALLKGPSIWSSVSQMLSNTKQGTIMQAASEAATGGYNLGNTQFANHSHSNLSANKYSDSTMIDTGRMQMINTSGGMSTITAGGNLVYDQGGSMHRFPIGFSTEGAVRTQLSEQAQIEARNAQESLQSASQYREKSIGQSLDAFNSYSTNQTSDNNWTKQLTAEQREAFTTLAQRSNENGITNAHDQSRNTQSYIHGTASTGVNVGVASIGGEIGSRVSFDDNKTTSWNESSKNMDNQDYEKAKSVVESYIGENREVITHANDTGFRQSFDESLRQSEQYQQSYNDSMARSRALSTAVAKIDENTVQSHKDLNNEFFDFARQQKDVYGNQYNADDIFKLLNSHDPRFAPARDKLIDQFKDHMTNKIINQAHSNYNQQLKVSEDKLPNVAGNKIAMANNNIPEPGATDLSNSRSFDNSKMGSVVEKSMNRGYGAEIEVNKNNVANDVNSQTTDLKETIKTQGNKVSAGNTNLKSTKGSDFAKKITGGNTNE